MIPPLRLAVVVPCYKVKAHVASVLARVPANVERIYVVDDACPEQSGRWVSQNCVDARIVVLSHPHNLGVGGAVTTGYLQAMNDGMDVVVKVDGDGQMDPALLPRFVNPILEGKADYTKGNRFYRPESFQTMPRMRLFGNLMLSFLTKFSSGYWPNMDPTNGYTAVSVKALKALPLDKLAKRYFFESDMLFRLNTIRAVVKDVPMDAVYGNEVSNLKISKVLPEFLKGNVVRAFKRYVYTYLVRDFSIGSLYSLAGIAFLLFGVVFGAFHWVASISSHVPSSSGTVMVAGLSVLIGVQFLIAFLHYDVANVPNTPISEFLD